MLLAIAKARLGDTPSISRAWSDDARNSGVFRLRWDAERFRGRFRWRTFACERRVRCDHRAHCGGFHDLRLVDLHRAHETNRSSRAEHAVRRRFRSRRFSRHSLRRRHGEHRALRRERRLEPSRVRASDEILKNRKQITVTVRHSHRPRRRIVESRTGRATYSENDARRRRVIFPDESSAP